MIKLKVLCSKGDEGFECENASEAKDILAKVEAGELEGISKGRYYLIDQATGYVIGKQEIQEGQMLVAVPVIAGG